MCKCEIQWIDDKGNPTPDSNPAVGMVYCKAHTFVFPSGRTCWIEKTASFPICAEHVQRMQQMAGMQHWIFEPFKDIT